MLIGQIRTVLWMELRSREAVVADGLHWNSRALGGQVLTLVLWVCMAWPSPVFLPSPIVTGFQGHPHLKGTYLRFL